MEGVQVVGSSQCSVAFREQYSLQVSLEHGQPHFRHVGPPLKPMTSTHASDRAARCHPGTNRLISGRHGGQQVRGGVRGDGEGRRCCYRRHES